MRVGGSAMLASDVDESDGLRSTSLAGATLAAAPAPPEVLAGADNQRLKGLVKGRLFGESQAPVRIGRFLVMRPLGSGGMGVVYAAYDEELDRRIAVKLLRPGSSEHDQARLQREAQAMARLSHPNVATVHEVGAVDGQIYVAMEYVRGQTLQEWLAAAPRSWREVIEHFRAAGLGLAAAHAAGLVHRDFKPSNVLVGDDGRVRVVDFGLVRSSGGEEGEAAAVAASQVMGPATPLATSLTMTGTIMGTPAYMSPEQHRGAPTDARSDQFSFCVALYEALHGVHPFAGRTVGEVRAAVLAGRVPPPPRESKAPVWLGRVLARGLAVDPAARWPSMDALLDALAADPEARASARRRGALGVVVAAAVILGIGWIVQERGEAVARAWVAETTARLRKEAAEAAQRAAQAERDRAFEEAKAQLVATQAAKSELEAALADAREQRALADGERRVAEEQRRVAEEQSRMAEEQRGEAERQATRAQQEARRARDTNRLAQALGAARDDPTTVLALLRDTEDPGATPGWVPAAVDTLRKPVSQAVLREHRGTVNAAAMSPDGRAVATAADDGAVLLWEWESGRVQRLGAHRGPVASVAFSPDGGAVLTASADGDAALWPVGGGAGRILGHGAPVRVAEFAGDGARVATGTADGTVRIWPAEGGAAVVLGAHPGPVHDLSFSPGGEQVASGGADGTARVWEVSAPGRVRVLGRHRGAVRAVAFAADGQTLATGGQDGVVRVWSPGVDEPRELQGHEDDVVALAFAGGALVSAALDGTARVWPAKGGAPRVLRGHRGRIYTAALAADGKTLVTASQDRSARIWDLERPEAPPRVFEGHTEELASAIVSPDGERVVTTSRDATVRVWRIRRPEDEARVLVHRGAVGCVGVDRRGERALACSGTQEVWVWGLGAPRARAERLSHPATVVVAAFDDEGAVITVTGDGAVRRWRGGVAEVVAAGRGGDAKVATLDWQGRRLATAALADAVVLRALEGGAERLLRGHTGTLHALAFGPGGGVLASGASDRSARLWRSDDGELLRTFGPHSGRVTALAFSPDGTRLATASWDKRARIFAVDGDAVQVLEGHEGPVWAIAFRGDGEALATGGDDGQVRVWPVDGGEAVVLVGHEGPVRALAWQADGRSLLSGGDDRSLRIWDTDFDPGALQRRLARASAVCLDARERGRLLGESSAVAEAAARACDEARRRP